MIIAAAAPPIAPHIAGFTDVGTCIVKLTPPILTQVPRMNPESA
jgi:hypothetical protein